MSIDIEAPGADQADAEKAFEQLALARRTQGFVLNPFLRRCWAKLGPVLNAESSAYLDILTLGDSIAAHPFLLAATRLKIEYGNGGIAGRLAGEAGWKPIGTAVSATETVSDFTNSPNGTYWDVASGGSHVWSADCTPNEGGLTAYFAKAYKLPRDVTRIGVWYTRRSGGGTFKVQLSTKSSPTSYSDVTGLTAVDTDGALGLQYAEVTISATNVERIKIAHVSGGNCYVCGALAAADDGVVSNSWTVGGLAMTAMVNSPRLAEWAATIAPDLVMTTFLDTPGDTAASTGLSVTDLTDGIMDGLRDALDTPTTVPPDPTGWSGKTALTDQPPDFVWFAGSLVESAPSGGQGAYTEAMRLNAAAAGDCFVDVPAVWGAWATAWSMGLMSTDDGNGSSTHPTQHFHGAVITAFLKETLLLGSVFSRQPLNILLETLQVGPDAPAQTNGSNRVKFGDGTTEVSFAPLDLNGFGDIAMMIKSSGPTFEAGFVLGSTAASGRRYIVTSQPGAGFILRDITSTGRNFLTYNASQQLSLGTASGDTVALGPKGELFSGLRKGTVALTSGTATVTNANLTTSAVVVVTRVARGGTVGVTYEVSRSAGSFTITSKDSSDATATSDTSTIAYIVVEP